ncbi:MULTISPECIES: carbohydrate ABC transporter permease [Rhizobium]|uniref:Permease component of ABC-type sugar transporter n=1 Tax=Rhizobium favelukesii TaxID=348824 RepID=W6RRG8_9HYPH|nr:MULTISPECIES: sugar ABC transporter permease [Rhizobium]MCS0459100.1 sugar ABC transporter permease [Rhizobium favelukesii]UFS79670.1 sugar ABC transporter permease [Rhizobium sp. T136]CDM63299.1 permease component of ABC-type sugar transporter [Rhizobium favelukesii]
MMNASIAAERPQRLGVGNARRRNPSPLPWLVPLILVLGIFYLYPLIDVFRFAFTNVSLVGADEQYTLQTIIHTLSRPELVQILWVTFVFTASSVVAQQVLGFFIAQVVVRSEDRGLFGSTIVRTTALVAWVVPGIAGGIIWKMLFNEAPFGGLNSLLRMVGAAPVQWLSDPDMVMWSVVISNVWRGTAFSMVVMYAAIKAIDPELYEAAEIDGANAWQRMIYITLPQLRTAILVNMILITIQTLNTFDAIISLTGGGPGRATEVLSLYTFNVVFRNYDLAAGAVLSILMLLISLGLALVYARFLPRGEPV